MSSITTPTPEQAQVAAKIMAKFYELGISCEFAAPLTVGPIITCYRFRPKGGTRVGTLEAAAQDIAVALAVEDVLIKRMPGEAAVGVFVPNETRRYLPFREIVPTVAQYMLRPEATGSVPLAFGQTETGAPFIEDLTTLPHLLMAGTTGSGKSTLMHCLIASIVWTMDSHGVELILSDTKGVEFTPFAGLPHLKKAVATTIYQTLEQLDYCVEETERRLQIIGRSGQRNIKDYNLLWSDDPARKLPYIVIYIDELADIMLGSGKKGEAKVAEEKIQKIVQKSRAAGIHLVAATQRPDVKVVAGTIKANFPARLTFRLPSEIDSRTIIGSSGAEHLLSRGDMLYLSNNRPGLQRLHAPFASVDDILACVDYVIHREKGAQTRQG